jgi:hypothetical protein
MRTPRYPCRTLGLASRQFLQARAQTPRVELGDGERADAALRASGFARQPVSAAPRGLAKRRIEDLD